MIRGDILLVDDDPGFLAALAKTMTKHGQVVTTAADVADALEAIKSRRQQFDLVITDLSMPKISGISLLTALRSTFPEVKVIVITAFGDQTAQTEALREGAFAFLEKPLDLEAFLGVIQRALKMRRPPSPQST